MTNKTITISRETFQGLLEGIAYGGYDNNSRTDMFHRVLGEPWETVTMCEADARLLLCGFSYVNEHREELLAALRRADEKEHSDHIAAEFEREGKKLPPGFHNCTAEGAVTGIFIPAADPVPPAGGEPEVFEPHGWAQTDGPRINAFTREFDIAEEWAMAGYGTVELLNREHVDDELDRLRGEHQAHVTRLQAEVERLRGSLDDACQMIIQNGRRANALQSELTKALELLIPAECPHMIVFDDADRETLMFAGEGARNAALKTWEQISGSWNAHLFVRVERNSRDDRYPSANQSAPADKGGDS